jgi:hypothetical protein
MKFKTARKYARICPQEGDQLDRITRANGTASYLVKLLAHLHQRLHKCDYTESH